MKNLKILTVLVVLIILISLAVALTGILSSGGSGEFEYMTIRGENVTIYGTGLYQHMSADVAIQGIAQDIVTVFIGLPFLMLSIYLSYKKNKRGHFILSGTLGYFLVTYLFYTTMAMYNYMYLAYVALMGLTFFAFVLTLTSYDLDDINQMLGSTRSLRNGGIFLILNSTMVAFLWLGIVIPPLLDGTLFPDELQHYTTLIVQGFDLGLLLPMGIVTGILALKKSRFGTLFLPIYLIFLSILMAALTSKILFMLNAGENVIPVIFIMPTVCVIATLFSIAILRNVKSINYSA